MPRCRNCKEKFVSTRFNAKYCEEIDCKTQEALYNLGKIKERDKRLKNKKRKEQKEKLKTKKDYEKELEVVFNRFIRERDKNQPCISCDAPAGTYKLTAGHFYPAGSYKNIRFNEDNVSGQCWYNCNKNKHGNLLEYRPRLINKIGLERVEELDRLAQIPARYTIPELIAMKVIYKDKIKKLK